MLLCDLLVFIYSLLNQQLAHIKDHNYNLARSTHFIILQGSCLLAGLLYIINDTLMINVTIRCVLVYDSYIINCVYNLADTFKAL